jgi:hypothetical protein
MRGLSPDPNGKVSILTKAGYGNTLGEIRGPQVCEIGSSVVLVDHLSAGACPATDSSAVDVGFYTQADEGMTALVALAVRNVASFEDGSPSASRKVVLINELPLGARE